MRKKVDPTKTFPLVIVDPAPRDGSFLDPPTLTVGMTPAEAVVGFSILLAVTGRKARPVWNWFMANRRRICNAALAIPKRAAGGKEISLDTGDLQTWRWEDFSPEQQKVTGIMAQTTDLIHDTLRLVEPDLKEWRGKWKSSRQQTARMPENALLLVAYDRWVAVLTKVRSKSLKARLEDKRLQRIPPELLDPTPTGRLFVNKWAKQILAHKTGLSIKTIERRLASARKNPF